MYDYNLSNDMAQQRYQQLIDQARHDALVRNLRRLNRKSHRNPLLVAITNLLPR